MRYAGLDLRLVTEEDMDDLHHDFAAIFRAYGIDDVPGGVLDHCVANCVRIAAAAIEARRASPAATSAAGSTPMPVLVWNNPAADVPAG
jgi:hypothetical protein